MKKRDGKIEHKENGVEKFFNLDKKLVEWIINEQLGCTRYVYCFINKIKTQDVALSKKYVIKITQSCFKNRTEPRNHIVQ